MKDLVAETSAVEMGEKNIFLVGREDHHQEAGQQEAVLKHHQGEVKDRQEEGGIHKREEKLTGKETKCRN